MKILIVEDEEKLRTQLKNQLVAEGYAVEMAADGEEGLYFGEEYEFDVGIIDLGLPKVDGIALIKKLRQKGKSFPILIPVPVELDIEIPIWLVSHEETNGNARTRVVLDFLRDCFAKDRLEWFS